MYFTKQDYEKILGYILDHSKKDTQFENASEIDGKELLSIIQEGVNKNITLEELLHIFDEHGVEVKIKQEEGDSEADVMSQKAVSDSLDDVRDIFQQQIDDINVHIGDPTSPEAGSIQSQIDTINSTIGGSSPTSIQNQLQSLREVDTTKLTKGSTVSGGDVIDSLESTDSNRPLSANQGYELNDRIDGVESAMDTFVNTQHAAKGMTVLANTSTQTLELSFTEDLQDTVYVYTFGDTLHLNSSPEEV